MSYNGGMKNIAVLGVGTMIGSELLRILEQRDFPAGEAYFMSPGDTSGEEIFYKGEHFGLHNDHDPFADKVDIVFSCLERVLARSVAPRFSERVVFIDCTRAFAGTPDVPCVIPEVNGDVLTQPHRVIANPGSMVIPLLMALHPLHVRFRLDRLHVVGMAAVSELGWEALDQLSYEYEYLATGLSVDNSGESILPGTIGGNLIPQAGDFTDQGRTEQEAMLIQEVSAMLGTGNVRMSATMVWAPVVRGHCLAVTVGFEKEAPLAEVRQILGEAPGMALVEGDEAYPMPESVVGKDEVFAGRLRPDKVFENGLSMWLACDNLRKGSALNAVQIAELLPA